MIYTAIQSPLNSYIFNSNVSKSSLNATSQQLTTHLRQKRLQPAPGARHLSQTSTVSAPGHKAPGGVAPQEAGWFLQGKIP